MKPRGSFILLFGLMVMVMGAGNASSQVNLLCDPAGCQVDASTIADRANSLSCTGCLTSMMIQDGTIMFADINSNGCLQNNVIMWDGRGWICGVTQGSTYTAGTGLSLNGTQFSLTPTYADGSAYDSRFVNEGQASSVTSTMIGSGTIMFSNMNQNGCIDGKVIKRVAGAWNCGDDLGSSYTAGTGLSLLNNQFSLAPTYADGSAYDSRFVNEGQASSVTSTMIGSGTVLLTNLNNSGCGTGQVPKWGGSAWTCGDDIDTNTTYTAGTGLILGGTQFRVAIPLNLSSGNPDAIISATNTSSISAPKGVYGYASAATGSTYGLYGESASSSGTGVYGLTSSSSGFTYGVSGESWSSTGIGVLGHATSTGASAAARGVYGQSDSPSGKGLDAWASHTSGTNYGVYGQSNSSNGYGVYGMAEATSGQGTGVYGWSKSPSGWGVYGYASAASGTHYGIYGKIDGIGQGAGVYGITTDSTLSSDISAGVRGIALGGNNHGVWGTASGAGYAVFGQCFGTACKAIDGRADDPSAYAGHFNGRVHVSGDFSATSKSFIQPHTKDPSREIVYVAAEAPEAMVMYRGTARLSKGKAIIRLPEHFSIVAAEQGVMVQFTPRSGGSKGLAAVKVSREVILVQELLKGRGSYEFDFFVTAKRAGFEGHQPVAENTHFRPTERQSVAEFEKQYRKDDMNTKALRDMMIANGILTEDGKLNRETVARLGWTVKEADLAEVR